MGLKHLVSKKVALSSIIAAALLATIAPNGISYGQSASSSSWVQFQIGSSNVNDYRGEHKINGVPYLQNGSAMVPVRALAEGLQADIKWNDTTREIDLARNGLTVHLTVDSNAVVGTFIKNVKLPQKVRVIKGNAYVPAKMVAQLLGANTSWSEKEKKILIEESKETISLSYFFDQSEDGWKGAFADLPVKYDPDIYELQYARELLPIADNKTNFGLKLKGMNRSDDLFMFVSKKMDGLTPNTTYQAVLSFNLYTDQAGGMMGVGGAPGEAVSIKAGIVSKQPEVIELNDGGEPYFRLNLDKGNQRNEGQDMKIVGTMVQPNDELKGYQPVAMSYSTTIKSNDKGELYFIIGSDSGYEGLTTLYLDDINVKLLP